MIDMIVCPKCKGHIRQLSKREREPDLIRNFITEEASLVDGDSYEQATILVCDACGWFDLIGDYGWNEWYTKMKSVLLEMKTAY